MSDYIDRQAAIDAIERLILPQTKGETAAEEIKRVAWRCAINCAEEMIGHLPTVEPVVRCQDCMFRGDDSTCEYSAVYVLYNGYCNWGMKKEVRNEIDRR